MKNILIVDDSSANRDFLEAVLTEKNKDYVITNVNSRKAALEVVRES